MNRKQERQAWTDFVEGRAPTKAPKYGNERVGKYASKKEADIAGKLAALERSGQIRELREQVPFELIPKNGKLRAIHYLADFSYRDKDGLHVIDVKGGSATKTRLYRLKARLLFEVHGITVEEV